MAGFKLGLGLGLTLRLKQRFLMFFLFCKVRPERLSEVALPQDANSFAESGRTGADTAVQTARMLYRKVVFRRFLLILCAFVSLCLVI